MIDRWYLASLAGLRAAGAAARSRRPGSGARRLGLRDEDVEDFVATSREMGGALGAAFGSAAPADQAAIVEELRASFVPFTTANGLELPGVALVALAR